MKKTSFSFFSELYVMLTCPDVEMSTATDWTKDSFQQQNKSIKAFMSQAATPDKAVNNERERFAVRINRVRQSLLIHIRKVPTKNVARGRCGSPSGGR